MLSGDFETDNNKNKNEEQTTSSHYGMISSQGALSYFLNNRRLIDAIEAIRRQFNRRIDAPPPPQARNDENNDEDEPFFELDLSTVESEEDCGIDSNTYDEQGQRLYTIKEDDVECISLSDEILIEDITVESDGGKINFEENDIDKTIGIVDGDCSYSTTNEVQKFIAEDDLDNDPRYSSNKTFDTYNLLKGDVTNKGAETGNVEYSFSIDEALVEGNTENKDFVTSDSYHSQNSGYFGDYYSSTEEPQIIDNTIKSINLDDVKNSSELLGIDPTQGKQTKEATIEPIEFEESDATTTNYQEAKLDIINEDGLVFSDLFDAEFNGFQKSDDSFLIETYEIIDDTSCPEEVVDSDVNSNDLTVENNVITDSIDITDAGLFLEFTTTSGEGEDIDGIVHRAIDDIISTVEKVINDPEYENSMEYQNLYVKTENNVKPSDLKQTIKEVQHQKSVEDKDVEIKVEKSNVGESTGCTICRESVKTDIVKIDDFQEVDDSAPIKIELDLNLGIKPERISQDKYIFDTTNAEVYCDRNVDVNNETVEGANNRHQIKNENLEDEVKFEIDDSQLNRDEKESCGVKIGVEGINEEDERQRDFDSEKIVKNLNNNNADYYEKNIDNLTKDIGVGTYIVKNDKDNNIEKHINYIHKEVETEINVDSNKIEDAEGIDELSKYVRNKDDITILSDVQVERIVSETVIDILFEIDANESNKTLRQTIDDTMKTKVKNSESDVTKREITNDTGKQEQIESVKEEYEKIEDGLCYPLENDPGSIKAMNEDIKVDDDESIRNGKNISNTVYINSISHYREGKFGQKMIDTRDYSEAFSVKSNTELCFVICTTVNDRIEDIDFTQKAVEALNSGQFISSQDDVVIVTNVKPNKCDKDLCIELPLAGSNSRGHSTNPPNLDDDKDSESVDGRDPLLISKTDIDEFYIQDGIFKLDSNREPIFESKTIGDVKCKLNKCEKDLCIDLPLAGSTNRRILPTSFVLNEGNNSLDIDDVDQNMIESGDHNFSDSGRGSIYQSDGDDDESDAGLNLSVGGAIAMILSDIPADISTYEGIVIEDVIEELNTEMEDNYENRATINLCANERIADEDIMTDESKNDITDVLSNEKNKTNNDSIEAKENEKSPIREDNQDQLESSPDTNSNTVKNQSSNDSPPMVKENGVKTELNDNQEIDNNSVQILLNDANDKIETIKKDLIDIDNKELITMNIIGVENDPSLKSREKMNTFPRRRKSISKRSLSDYVLEFPGHLFDSKTLSIPRTDLRGHFILNGDIVYRGFHIV